MDSIRWPERSAEAKRFGSLKFFKWHLYHNTSNCLLAVLFTVTMGELLYRYRQANRLVQDGRYQLGVLKMRYTVVRPDDPIVEKTPVRYRN